jgi:predicted enzyme related to lactoylglutathione lyase
MNAENGDVI